MEWPKQLMGFRVGHCHLQLTGLAVGMNIIYVKTEERVKELTPVFQRLVSVIHWINHYPVDVSGKSIALSTR